MNENMKSEHSQMNSIHNDVDANNDVDKCW